MPSTPGMATNVTVNAGRCTMAMESDVGRRAARRGKLALRLEVGQKACVCLHTPGPARSLASGAASFVRQGYLIVVSQGLSRRLLAGFRDVERVPYAHTMHARPDHDDLVAMMIAQESDAAAGEPRGLVQRGEPLQFDLRRDGNVMGRFARHVWGLRLWWSGVA